jgi:hypothetical protein
MCSRTILPLVIAVFLASPLLAHEEGFPEKTLKSVFPQATGFTPRKRTFTAVQIKQIEQASASKLQRNDNPLTFYVALGKSPDGSGVLGTVILVDAQGPRGIIDLALAVRRDGTIEKVLVTENADDAALSTAAFLNQLQGKNASSPLAFGKDIRFTGNPQSAEVFLSAVRRGLQMIAAVVGSA